MNGRSYIIRDNCDNYFRRNRRFIAKTRNDNFNASEMLFEEHIKRNVTSVPDGLKEIEIVPPPGHIEVGNKDEGNDSNDRVVDEPEMPDDADSPASSADDYETAGSSGSEAESNIEQEAPAPIVTEPNTFRTRSGRVVRPPVRYGCP